MCAEDCGVFGEGGFVEVVDVDRWIDIKTYMGLGILGRLKGIVHPKC